MLEVVLIVLALLAMLFPVAYCFHRRLSHKLLFVCAVFGAQFIIQVLLSAAALPVIAFNIHGLPQLQAFGIHWPVYSSLSAVVAAYGWLLLHSLLLLILPLVIHRRYRRHFAPTSSQPA